MIFNSWNKRDKVMSCTKAAFLGSKVLSAEQVPVPLVWLLTFLLLFQRHLPLHLVQKDPSPGQGALGRKRRETKKMEGGLFLMSFLFSWGKLCGEKIISCWFFAFKTQRNSSYYFMSFLLFKATLLEWKRENLLFSCLCSVRGISDIPIFLREGSCGLVVQTL